MRFLQVLGCVAMMVCSHTAAAIQLTDAQLDELRLGFEQQSLNAVLHESTGQLYKHLQGLSPSQAIWLKHQWLRKLSTLTQPSAEQQRWLENQLISTELLTIANPDHPNQQLVIIDIARQAKATSMHWQINQHVEQLQTAWDTSQWDWQQVLQAQDRVSRHALKQWLQNVNERRAQQVAEDYLKAARDIPQANNQLLATLGIKAKSPELLALLWQQPADEYSYVALSKLPSMLDDYQVVEQLVLALKNKDIQSQALFTMASRYSSNSKVQQVLSMALDEPELKWRAAAVLSKVRDQDFAASLDKKLSRQAPSSFSRLAQKNLQQAKDVGAQQ
ncbi:MAG: hypothetical protein ACI88A_000508 [Paraglaciecola sp.]|jgi:uncharacterized protein (DUF736 family)